MSLYTIAILILLHVTIAPSFASSDGSCCTLGSATYEIKFTGLWVNNASYPFYPSNFPHWSPVIGAVHSPALTIYEYGKLASPEVKAVAESGVTKPLKDLLTPMTDKVKQIFVSPSSSLGPTATYTATVTVNKTFNLLSALTMIAPSPDWCVGVSRVNFCTSQCGFIDDRTIDLYLWDAGTKAGPTEQYSYAGTATSVPIYQLHSTTNSTSVFYRANDTSLPPFAKLQISKVSQTLTDNSGSCCAVGSSTYEVKFTGLWANDPKYPFYPSNFPHWSPFIGAVHSPDLTIYKYGQLASSQVKEVAESGRTKPLNDLLTPMTTKVKQIFVSPGSYLQPTETYKVTVNVNNTFNLLSALTMIAPSPDWCVGVSRANLCTKQCGFLTETTMDLFLWDAGTKAGPTEQYSYAGNPTSIPIYQLQSTNDATSVFYRPAGGPLPPFAKLQISKVSQSLTDNDGSCCTRGSATYQIKFTGLWVNSTKYPYYPSNAPHWSAIIGAVHSPALTIYKYGQLASSQVKAVAEAGQTKPLQDLLTPMTDKVKKIFVSSKTFLQPTEVYTVTVEVNDTFNLMSLLTMIAPSPDWCVGASRVNFCSRQCGFIGNTTMDLFLWDAGTKAGSTEQYTYAGAATTTPIYQLKSTNDSSSVFYRPNGDPLPPFARLEILRLSQNLAATTSTPTRGVPTTATDAAMGGPSQSFTVMLFALAIATIVKFF